VVEVLELNRVKLGPPVDYVLADVFAWEPPRVFDVCFSGFWLSHVPSGRFETLLAACRAPAEVGRPRVSRRQRASRRSASHRQCERRIVRRSLSDGREFEIVKRSWAPTELESELAALGRQLSACATPNGHFVFASGQR
jgi:demethylmenaquinone methyltransferase/2-methoxy-6-polyprenyl-1,4-benzoquinol methylase